MNVPPLKINSRDREFKSYPEDLRDVCVYKFLFEGTQFRQLDREVLSLNSQETKGFQSMGIIHHMGLYEPHQGIFKDFSMEDGIELLRNENTDDFSVIIDSLLRYSNSFEIPDPLESVVVTGEEEGRKIQYYTTKYERSRKNRSDAIRIHGTVCMACGFDFKKTYGSLGEGFIEVHHIRPLSSRDEIVVVDPEKDLVCLCSNCHRMIHHSSEGILTLEELKEIIVSNKGS